MSEITAYVRGLEVHSTGHTTNYKIGIMEVKGGNSILKLAEPSMDGVVYGPQTLTEDQCRESCMIAKGLVNGVRCSGLRMVERPSNSRVKDYAASASAVNFKHLKVVTQLNGTTTNYPNEFDEMALANSLPCQKGGMIFPDQVLIEQASLETPTVK